MATRHRSSTRTARSALLALLALLTLLLVVQGPFGLPGATAQDATEQATEPSPGEAPTPDGDSLTWSVRPTPTDDEPERPNFSYVVAPGETVEDSIRVRNFGSAPLPLVIYASDAILTTSGALDLLPADEEPTDVGAWIALVAEDFEVAPGEAVDIPFEMVVPDGVEPGDHVGGIVTSYQVAGEGDDGQNVVLDRRLGSRVQVRVDGPLRPSLEVQDLEVTYDGTLNPFSSGTAHVNYTVANTGNVRLTADRQIVLPGRFGVPGQTVTLDPVPELLPGTSLEFEADIDGVWPSFQTIARVELQPVPSREGDTFDADPVVLSATTPSVPWGQLAILALVLLVIGYVVWNRRRRRRREAAIREEALAQARAEARGPAGSPVGDAPLALGGSTSGSSSAGELSSGGDDRESGSD